MGGLYPAIGFRLSVRERVEWGNGIQRGHMTDEPAGPSSPTPPESPGQGERWRSPDDGAEMVWVEGGSFTMGTAPPEGDDDEVAHEVRVAGFWMDVEPVSNARFQEFLNAWPEWQKRHPAARMQDPDYLDDWFGIDCPTGQADWPVAWVSWPAARACCQWAGKRLPTEAEWEYACRAGTRTRYWWGDEFVSARAALMRTAVRAGDRTSPWGLTDMIGNVWEWTSSLYAQYPYDACDGREDEEAAGERVLRGGPWPGKPKAMRSSFRERNEPLQCLELSGFRCVRTSGCVALRHEDRHPVVPDATE
jgi:gamma-glutamyl hercynylcysteine S-oxide synthase